MKTRDRDTCKIRCPKCGNDKAFLPRGVGLMYNYKCTKCGTYIN